ncbi:MAG: YggS family pyridoxal phosphate-dependent enzyme [Paludibacteraceae bacterium]|nr:YggS family pyridoxal phosphate-dependent enzyme [Paludibacteraceae bacterium]
MNNWLRIQQSLPADVRLVAVSKYHTAEQIAEVYAAGCRDFGESRVLELKAKQAALPQDIRWHFIGHLQTNKVRDLLRLRPSLIQSVDSERLLRAINSEAEKQGIVQDVLLELHVAREETKSGFSIDEFHQLIANSQWPITNVRICGLMGMATNTDDEQEIRRCFRTLHEQYQWLNCQLSIIHCQLSMGMSDDYLIALSEGSTMVRIGSAIFD